MSESRLQQNCVQWFRTQYPQVVIASFPNEGKRSYANASRMKAQGLMPGMPDLFIAKADEQYHGLFIELKFGKGKLTDAQNLMVNRLINSGYKVRVCWSFEDFVAIVNDYLLSNE